MRQYTFHFHPFSSFFPSFFLFPDLSNNKIQGYIPTELARLSLSTLNLANNYLAGSLPRLNSSITALGLQSNPELCGDASSVVGALSAGAAAVTYDGGGYVLNSRACAGTLSRHGASALRFLPLLFNQSPNPLHFKPVFLFVNQ